jgi:DNA-binding XRE family transcriptional regulator
VNERDRNRLEKLTPDQRSKLDSILADLKRPEIVEQHEADRATLDREFRETGTIATEGDESTAAEFLAFRKFMGRMRALRESKGLSIDDVARLSGLERRMVSKLEIGMNDNPTLRTLTRYCGALGVSIDWQVASAVAS